LHYYFTPLKLLKKEYQKSLGKLLNHAYIATKPRPTGIKNYPAREQNYPYHTDKNTPMLIKLPTIIIIIHS
jgi:hypothetical protein